LKNRISDHIVTFQNLVDENLRHIRARTSPAQMPRSGDARRKVDGVYRRAVLCTVSFAILLRLCTGTHSYSGAHMFTQSLINSAIFRNKFDRGVKFN